MKKLFHRLFHRKQKTVWPYCNKTYSFPPWPNMDCSKVEDVRWEYIAVNRKGKV